MYICQKVLQDTDFPMPDTLKHGEVQASTSHAANSCIELSNDNKLSSAWLELWLDWLSKALPWGQHSSYCLLNQNDQEELRVRRKSWGLEASLQILPEPQVHRPAMALSIEVLPAPLGPTTKSVSSWCTCTVQKLWDRLSLFGNSATSASLQSNVHLCCHPHTCGTCKLLLTKEETSDIVSDMSCCRVTSTKWIMICEIHDWISTKRISNA